MVSELNKADTSDSIKMYVSDLLKQILHTRIPYRGTDCAYRGTDCAYRGTDCAYRGTDCAYRGTDYAYQGTDWTNNHIVIKPHTSK